MKFFKPSTLNQKGSDVRQGRCSPLKSMVKRRLKRIQEGKSVKREQLGKAASEGLDLSKTKGGV